MEDTNNQTKKNTKSKKKDQANSLKNGILSIIGGIFHKIAIGSIFVGLGFSTYMISYLHDFQDKDESPLTQQHTYFLMPILTVTMGLGIPFSAILEFKLGTKITIFLGSIFLIISSVIQYFSHNFYLNLFGIFIFAIGLAISIAISGKNACMYFPSKRGMVSGLLALISAIVSSSFNLLGEKIIINPNSEEPIDGYYPVDCSKNILHFYLFQMICVGVCTIFCLSFIVPYKMKRSFGNKNKKNNKKDNLIDKIEENMDKEEALIPEDNNEEQKEKVENKEETKKEENNEEIKKEENNEEIKKEENNEEKKKEENNEEKKKEENNEEKKKEEEKKEENSKEGKKEDDKKKQGKNDENNEIEDKPLTIENKEENDEQEEKNQKKGDKEFIPNGLGGLESSMVNASVNYSMVQIKTAAKSFRVWRLFLMGIFSSPLNNFILLTWRPISIFKQMPTNKIQNVNSYISIIQMITTPLFGFLSDKLPFRLMKVSLGIINTIVGYFFYFSFENVNFFILLILVNSVANYGSFALNEPHYMKVFGMKHFIEIAGIVGLASVIMGPINSFFAFFIEKNFRDNLDTAYKFMFLSGASLNIVDVVLSIFETDDPLFE